jgi:NAD(P)H-flavin reductase
MARATVAPKIIYFSVSYEKELFYHQELFDLGCDETYIHVSRESVNGCEMGRVDLSNPNFPLESEFYLCGSPQSVASFQEQLANRGYKNIFMEKY